MPTLGSHLNFSQLEARNAVIHNLSAAPSSPVKGQLYFDTVSNVLFFYNGTIWVSSSGGTPADATTTTKGIVQLAGDLTGTAAAPAVATGAITSAKIADGTITDVDVAAANKDGVAGTASMRTLGTGAAQAMQGTQTLTGISTANANPGPVQMNSQRLTALADPTAAQDGATKNYVDTVAQGLDAKQSAYLATTGNITLSGNQTIDGLTTLTGSRVLVKNQTDPTQNGIYVAGTGAWTRATDMDVWTEVPGAFCWVENGTTQADTGWVCTSDASGGPIGASGISWAQFTGAAMITAGAGITKTGNTLSATVDGTTIDAAGAGTSLEVKAAGITATQLANGAVQLNTAVVGNILGTAQGGTGQSTVKAARETGLGAAGYYNNNATHGAGTTITITQATHLLRASRAIHVQVQDNATGNVELPDISVAANGDVTITYAASVSANSKLVTLVG